MPDRRDWNTSIIEEFRANEGRVGGPFEGATLLLLHHRGAKSGVERVNPLAYQDLGEGHSPLVAQQRIHPMDHVMGS